MSENKPDLMAELAEVVRLSERATAGEWRTEYRKSPRGYGQEVFDSSGATIAELAWHAVPKNETTTTTDREPNAQLIVAAVNFLRTHHAELEAVVRDARGEREESWEVWQDDMCVAGSDGFADANHYLMMYGQDGPVKLVRVTTYRETITPEQIAAMHNSAREG